MAEWGRREGTVSPLHWPLSEEIRLEVVNQRVSAGLCNV